jgi:hypothetical protein
MTASNYFCLTSARAFLRLAFLPIKRLEYLKGIIPQRPGQRFHPLSIQT